jgi:cobalt-precorrin 5A hydrolase
MIAAGLGCRKGCDVDDMLNALTAALEDAGRPLADVQALCAPDFKGDEASLAAAARAIEIPLVLLPLERLQEQAPFVLTSSDRVARHVGLPSVAETAALAGAARLSSAGVSARLLGPRRIVGGATCALATTVAFP